MIVNVIQRVDVPEFIHDGSKVVSLREDAQESVSELAYMSPEQIAFLILSQSLPMKLKTRPFYE